MVGYYIAAGNIRILGAIALTSLDQRQCSAGSCGYLWLATPGCVAFNNGVVDNCACALITGDMDLSSAPEIGNTDWNLFRIKLA